MTHLWKVSDFQAEIQHLAKLVEKRPNSQVVETMTTTLCSKISAVDIWTTQAIVTMLEEVEAHHFPADLATKLNAAIEKLEPVTGAPVRLSKASQVINNLPAWLTAKDWTRMASNVTIQDQLQVVAQRLVSMGVSSLRENTKCQAVAIVLHQQHCLGKPELQPHAIHSLWVISRLCTKMQPWAKQVVHQHARSTPMIQTNWGPNGWPNAMAKKLQSVAQFHWLP